MAVSSKKQKKPLHWTEIKNALLYGKPKIARTRLQPQSVVIAIHEITRLVDFGWIEELTDEALQRIELTCQKVKIPEAWEEFRYHT